MLWMLFIKKFTNLSLKYKFLIVFFVFITLPTIFLGVLIYLQSNELLKEQAQDSTQSILDKIEGNLSDVIQTTENISAFAIYNEDFRTFMTASKDNFNKPFYRQSIDNIKGYLTFQLLSNEYINSIAVKGENGNFINFGEPLSGDERHYDRLAIDKEGGIFWSDIYELHSGWSETEVDVISLSRVINDYNNIKEHIGFIRIRLDSDKLANIIEIPNLQGEAAILLTDMNKKVIMNVQTSKNMIVEQSLLATLDQMLSLADYSIEKDKYLIVNRKVAGVDWNLTAIVNKNQIAKRLVNIKQSIRNMVIFLTVFGLIALIGYYYSDVRRIINLTKTTERMEKKDFSVRVYDDSKDEIGVLGYRFNKMVETIRNHIDIEYKLKLSQKESESVTKSD
jgi:two-component system, sensor histidine kinase YesM